MKRMAFSLVIGILIGAAVFGSSSAVAASGTQATPTWQKIYVDGKQVDMDAYNINGSNYVKLRDVGKQLGINVYWQNGVQVDTTSPYTGEAPKAASALYLSSYKGSTLKVGDRSGLIVSPSDVDYAVTSSDPSVVAVEQVSGNWVAVAKSSGTATITATAAGYTAGSLTLTVEADATTTQPVTGSTVDLTANMALRQEMIQRINQVRRENGVAELSINDALMNAAQDCSAQGFTSHNSQYECETALAYGYPYGFGSNLTWFSSTSDISGKVEKAVTNWVNSPGHFQTMIDPNVDCIGVGMAVTAKGTTCFMFVGDPSSHNPYE